jgi:tetratricopeptide (TPR) repeat protein
MENNFDTSFINETVEKTPFTDSPAQNFFKEWCKINDSITPQFIDREEWEQRGVQGILEKNDQGKQTLFLPHDLHLWEMLDVVKTVDHDTFARTPEKRQQRADQIQKLGTIFEKAGLYLAEYTPILEDDKGKPIAQDIAREFYQYGLSLQHKERKTDQIPQDNHLSEEDKSQLDEWFLGRDAYQKRLARLGQNPTEEQIEEARKKTLSVYFKALTREVHKSGGEKPWETKVDPIQHLQNKTKRQIEKAIEIPERELKTSIFRRGVERLVTDMKEVGWRKAVNNLLKKIGFNPLIEQRKLYDTLHINELKQELEEVRKTGDISQISAKELENAKIIQKAVSSFPYEKTANKPSEMVETQFINCVGSSILGGGLDNEVGLKYLHVDLPEHSVTVLITSDGKVYWQDFTPPNGSNVNYKEITSNMLEGNIDLANLANIQDSGFTIKFRNWTVNNKKLEVTLFRPEIGLQCHILNRAGNTLVNLGRNKEALEAFRQATNIDPKYNYPYNGLGNALANLGRNEEALVAYQQAININPEYDDPYNGLGNVLVDLGRNEEAIEAYKKFIELCRSDKYWINRAKRQIKKLQRK